MARRGEARANNGYPIPNLGRGAPAQMFDAQGRLITGENLMAYGNNGPTKAGEFADYIGFPSAPRRFLVGGDWSSGHSGSPVFAYQYCSSAPVGRGPFAVGIAAAEGPCDGISPLTPEEEIGSFQLVNYARGMASDLTGIVSYYRATYP